MKEESGLSLHDALLWKKCEVVSATEFVAALHLFQAIDKNQAIAQFCELMVSGLHVHDKSEPKLLDEDPERWADFQGLALVTAITKRDGDNQIHEIDGKPLPDFENLQVARSEAFNVFAKLHVKEPYPWPYPMEWLTSDDDDEEEADQLTKKSHGNSELNATIRERIAWACLAVLAKYPEECRTKEGKVLATKLRNCMDQRAQKRWPTGSPPRESKTIEGYITKALKSID